jgi:hypothetical protein
VYSGFGNDICVEAIAEVDGVDIVTAHVSTGLLLQGHRASLPFQIRVHDGEENL